MRLLSELFPNFVKKSQIERLDEGPFGAGVMKARKYLKPGEEAPQGVKVQTGPQGGRYYEDMGGGGGGPQEAYPTEAGGGIDYDEIDRRYYEENPQEAYPTEAQGGGIGGIDYDEIDRRYYEDMGGGVGSKVDLGPQKRLNSNIAAKEDELGRTLTNDEKRKVFNETNAAAAQGLEPGRKPDVTGKVDLGPQKRLNNNIATKEGQLGRKLTNDEQRKVFEATMAAAAQGVEADEDALPMSILRDDPAGFNDEQGFDTEGPQPSLDERQARATQGHGDYRDPSRYASSDPTGEHQQADREADVNAWRAQGLIDSPSGGDVSGPTFDGQGNVQLPGSDPFPVGELTGSMVQESGLKEQYEAETGFSIGDDTSAFFDDYGNVGLDSFDSTLMDEWELDEDSQFDASSFLDWINSKSGTETMKMAKMMQTYNIDNTRRDPIVLANKGGNQRRNVYVRGIYKK